MPGKQKPPDGRQPLYVVQRPDLEALKRQGHEYAHPRVMVGNRYGDSGVDYFSTAFTVEFQVSLKPAADDTATKDGHAYGGSVDLRLDQVVEVGKVVARVEAKALALAPDQRDEFHRFIVGLRGCGFREAVMTTDFSRVAFLR
jgi:hypothetical protein